MTYLHKTNCRNKRQLVVMALYHTARVIDFFVFFLTLTYMTSELGAYIIFNERLDDWSQ